MIGICFAEPPPPPLPISVPSSFEQDDQFVLLISGLNFRGDKDGGDEDARRILYCRLFADWITGKVGDAEELSKISRIVRVVIAGGSISQKCHSDGRELGQIARYRARKAAPPSAEAVRFLDNFLQPIVVSGGCFYFVLFGLYIFLFRLLSTLISCLANTTRPTTCYRSNRCINAYYRSRPRSPVYINARIRTQPRLAE